MVWVALNIIFCFKFFILNVLLIYILMENPNYKNQNIEKKYVKTRKNHFLEFIELKDKIIKREIEELFLKPIVVSIERYW